MPTPTPAGAVDGGDVVQARARRRVIGSEVIHTVSTAAACDEWYGRGRSFLAECPPVSALGALTDAGGEFLHVIEHLTPLRHLVSDLLLGVHHRGVVSAERLPDLGE
jgi:hypothetical protein